MQQTIETIAAVKPVRHSRLLNTSAARAFDVFTGDTGKWWPKDYSLSHSPMQDLIIEPRAAGRLYERGEDGSETPWGDVILWKPPHRVVLAWRINEVFAYDPELLTEVDVRFVPRRGDLCSVEFEHRGLERMGAGAEMARGQLDGGWAGLLDLFKGAAEMTA